MSYKLWQHGNYGAKKEGEAVPGGDCGQGVGAGACGYASSREGGIGEKEEAGEAQAHAGEAIGRNGLMDGENSNQLKVTVTD